MPGYGFPKTIPWTSIHALSEAFKGVLLKSLEMFGSLPGVLLDAFTGSTRRSWGGFEQLERRKRIAKKIGILNLILENRLPWGKIWT